MLKRALFWILTFLLILPLSVNAVNIELTETAIQDIILEQGNASFLVTITNNQETEDSFRFLLPAVYSGWRIEQDPAQITISAEESETVKLTIIPTKLPKPDSYGFGIKLISNTNETQFIEHTYTFKVVTFDQAIKTSLTVPENINPNQENLFRLQLENRFDTQIEDIKAVLESEYFREEKSIVLRPYETIKKDFVINFNPPVEQGEANVEIKILKGGEEKINRVQTMAIGDFPIIESTTNPLSDFLLKKDTIVKTNNGNSISTETYTKQLGFFEKIFTNYNIEPTQMSKEGNIYILTWEFELAPGETRLIEIETNYRYFTLAIIILIVLIYIIYRISRRDISITKKLVFLRRSKEGISSMNIMLAIKNKSNKPINNLKIMDIAPNTVEKPENFGSLKPSVIQQGANSTRMMWELNTINKGHEIVISYTAKSKIPLLADIKLSPAIVKYITGKRRFIVRSNRVKLI